MPGDKRTPHVHDYVAIRQVDKPDRKNKPRGMVTFTFLKCRAPGQCDHRNKMTIQRWTANRDV